MPVTDFQREQVIARIDPRARMKWVWRPILLILISVVIAFFFVTVQSALRANSASGMPGIMFQLCLVGIIAVCVPLIANIIKQFREEALIVLDGQLAFRGAEKLMGSVALDNIAEVQIRRRGALHSFGMSRGIGLVLIKPEFIMPSGRVKRLAPRTNFWLLKSHLVFPTQYREPPEQIAYAIADAVKAATGRDVTVSIVGGGNDIGSLIRPGGGEMPMARPAGGVAQVATAGLSCIDCGYDLRLLSHAANCPECGMPVRRSLGGHLLQNSDAGWVATLRVGAAALALTGFFFLITIGLGMRYELARAIHQRSTFDAAFAFLAAVAASLSFVAGSILLTARQPSRSGAVPDSLSRRIARFALALPLLFIALSAAAIAGRGFVFASSICGWLFAAAVVLWYSRKLWNRVPNQTGAVLAILAALYFAMPVSGGALFLAPRLIGGVTAKLGGKTAASRPTASQPAPAHLRTLLIVTGSFAATIPLSFAAIFGGLWLKLRRIKPMPLDGGGTGSHGLIQASPVRSPRVP